MILLISLTILTGLLGQLVKLPFSSGNIYPLDIFVFITVFVWIIIKLINRGYKLKIPKFFIPLFFFLLWASIALVLGKRDVSSSEFLVGISYFLRLVFYSLFAFVVSDLKKGSDPRNVDSKPSLGSDPWMVLLKVLIFSSVALAVTGFIQLLIYPDLSFLVAAFGYDPHKNRLVSTFLDPNFTAAYLVLGLVLIFSRSKADSKLSTTSLYSNVVKWGLAAILFMALILTFSRSGWIMFSVVLFLYGILRSPKLLAVAFLGLILAYFAIPRIQTRISGLTDPDDSAKLRLVSWSRALTIFEDNPLFGVGYNLYRSAQERYGFFDFRDLEGGHAGGGSDSSFLLILATTGGVGFLLFLILYSNLFILSLKNISQPVGLALALSLFGLFFDSQFINSLFFPQIMLWLWVLIGLA